MQFAEGEAVVPFTTRVGTDAFVRPTERSSVELLGGAADNSRDQEPVDSILEPSGQECQSASTFDP
ncbi:MAG: hypothetical protein ACLPN2_04780 [Terriglobales bacterium]